MTDLRPNWPTRLAALRQRWQPASSVNGQTSVCVIASTTNIEYLTGFRGSAGMLVQDDEQEFLLLDGRYTTVAAEAIAGRDMADLAIESVETTYDAALAALIGRLGAGRIVYEPHHVTVSALGRWQAGTQAGWEGSEDLVEPMRVIKDQYEIAILRRAGLALAGVAARLADWVRPGRSEREIAADINRGLERAGFERPAFDTIVACGANSALPHARPGESRLADGHLVVLDFGGVLDGYCVDLTRMAGVGRLGIEAVGIFHAVREAQQAALDVIRAGVAAGAVDAAARQVLETKGLGAAFVHGTGHGLGLEVHEAPRLSRLSDPGDLLKAGMVCTIEPGAYVPGVGGARLEDDVLVTDRGGEVLTPGSRDLVIV